jgi:transposase
LEVREFKCENCGEHLDRDQNAAKNILQFAGGQPVKGHGEHISHAKASASARNARRSVNQPSSANV